MKLDYNLMEAFVLRNAPRSQAFYNQAVLSLHRQVYAFGKEASYVNASREARYPCRWL